MKLKTCMAGAFNRVVRRYAGPFWRRRHWLNRTQWFSKQQLDQLQLRLIQQLVRHCYETIPFYKDVMEHLRILPSDIKTLEDIKRFPVMKKQDVLTSGDSMISTKYKKRFLRKAHTGGTTGTPMNIYRNLSAIGTEHAFVRRQFDWAKIKMTDRTAYLTGRIIAPPNQKGGRLYDYDPFMKELILSTYHLSEQTAKHYLEAMKQYQVKAVIGYPSAVTFLARVNLDTGYDLPLKAAMTSSETLTASMRSTINKAFQCPVYDFYGSAERVCYIFTCEEGRYHLQPEYGYTELMPVDDAGRHKIVSTGFWNSAMPFIRYEMEDTVIASGQTCACGRAFPTIESISGRMADIIKTPSGREFGAAILTHLLYGTDHILESQIVQDRLDHIYIDYVPGEVFCQNDMDAFKALIIKHLPDELKVEFRSVQTIPRTAGGKIRPVVSFI